MNKLKIMRKIVSVLVVVTLIISYIPMNVMAQQVVNTEFAGGSGTETDPYLIATKDHLNNVRNYLDAHYKLTSDIVFEDEDFSASGRFYNGGKGWEPIATGGKAFRGVFDGDNHIIQGLFINISKSIDETSYNGLFGSISDANIKNLKLVGSSIYVYNNNYIYAGCISGYAYESNIINCSAEGTITAKNINESCALYAGGIIGNAVSTSVSSAESNVNINSEGNDRIGGICGHISSGSILNASNHGVLEGRTASGGITGEASNSTIENCFNYGSLNNSFMPEALNGSCDCGGIVAWANGKVRIMQCFNYGKISSYSTREFGSRAAGIVATMTADKRDNAIISKCYNSGEISSSGANGSNAGGIVATLYFSTISDCFNLGKISSTSNAGGIVSFSQSITATKCYNVGDIIGSYAGGIVGENISSNFYNCIYLDNVSSASGKGTMILTKCTSEEMQQKHTFTDWDFENTWEFLEGNAYLYPTFKDNEYYLVNENLDFQSGNGTEDSPYLIACTKHFNNIRKHLNANFKLVRDIVFDSNDFSQDGNFYNNGQGWLPIGSSADNAFCGVLDGNDFTIENVTNNLIYKNENVSGSNRVYSTYAGLFGYNKGILRNLNVSNAKIDIQLNSIRGNWVKGYVGMICAENEGTIEGCSVSGKVRSTENYIAEQTVYTQVNSSVGGISGNNSGIIRKCSSEALVVGSYAGGIVGDGNREGAIISECYNIGLVSGSDYASGICSGVNYGEISKCYNSGLIDGMRYVSGISSNNGGNINNCFNSGELQGGSFVGGIVGDWNSGNISHCYNVGSIDSTDYFGGIIFPSENSSSGTVIDSYYLDNISEEVGSGRKEGIRCSSEQMQNKDCYGNYDFSAIWEFDDKLNYDFPTLKDIGYISGKDKTTYESTDGTGKWWDPYKIRTKDDLNNVRYDLDACYKLINDIEFDKSDFEEGGAFYNEGQGWIPIGEGNCALSLSTTCFKGIFDGSGHYISGLSINIHSNNVVDVGLFACNHGGEIRNLSLRNSIIQAVSSTHISVAGIAGRMREGTISNVNVVDCMICAESTHASSTAAGIVALSNGIIKNSYNASEVTSKAGGHVFAGGIIGSGSGNVANCYNTGKVESYHVNGGTFTTVNAGGTIGEAGNNTTLQNCYNIGIINSKSDSSRFTYTGGIVGNAYPSVVINNCFYSNEQDSGSGESVDVNTSIKCTIKEMKEISTYAGFDFENIWTMGGNQNYFLPELRDNSMVDITPEIRAIEIVQLPSKQQYLEEAEELDLTGGKLAIYYNTGANTEVDIELDMVSGFDNKKVGEQELIVTYEGFTSKFVVTIEPKQMSHINVTTKPSKLLYWVGENFDSTGMIVTAYYNNGTSEVVTDYSTSGYDSTQGMKEITVLYNDLSDSFQVEVKGILGDLNCDKMVTDADALYLLYHTIFGDSYPVRQYCDYDKDGLTTDADALYLLYHTIFGESYPLN